MRRDPGTFGSGPSSNNGRGKRSRMFGASFFLFQCLIRVKHTLSVLGSPVAPVCQAQLKVAIVFRRVETHRCFEGFNRSVYFAPLKPLLSRLVLCVVVI